MRISDWSSDVCSSDLFGWLLEIAIEAHRYDTHQQPSARGGLDEARPHLDQPIGLQRRQPRQGVGEIAQEIDIEARLDVGDVDPALAHQLLDHIGTQYVVTVQMRSEAHTSELQSLMRHSYAVFC